VTAAAYSAALDAAYDRKTPQAVVSAVKQVIINQIRQIDPAVRIESTDYFNHTFAPDLVLHWERERSSRQLFVRQDSADLHFAEDLEPVVGRAPIIFSLEPSRARMRVRSESEQRFRSANLLVTDAAGVEEISERRSNRVVSIASPSVLQGARGILDADRATTMTTGLARGFVAAGNLAADETRDAVELIDHFFQRPQASKLAQFLRAVWVGAGGPQSAFPGAVPLQAGLSTEALSFLLEFEQNDSIDYWRRVGVGLDLERLIQLRPVPSRNFDRLVAANLDRVQGRACSVRIDLQDELVDGPSEWGASESALVWRGPAVRMRIAGTKETAQAGLVDQDIPVSLDQLVSRARLNAIPLASVEILAEERRIGYGVTSEATRRDISDDEQLRSMVGALDPTARVRQVVASLPDGRSLVCDFRDGIAAGRGGAKFTLLELLRFALPLLAATSDEDTARAKQIQSGFTEAVEPASLFDIP